MYGICGVIGMENPREVGPIARWMIARPAHRGSDYEGQLEAAPAALGTLPRPTGEVVGRSDGWLATSLS